MALKRYKKCFRLVGDRRLLYVGTYVHTHTHSNRKWYFLYLLEDVVICKVGFIAFCAQFATWKMPIRYFFKKIFFFWYFRIDWNALRSYFSNSSRWNRIWFFQEAAISTYKEILRRKRERKKETKKERTKMSSISKSVYFHWEPISWGDNTLNSTLSYNSNKETHAFQHTTELYNIVLRMSNNHCEMCI
jgi:hypothetical protein